MSRRFAARAGAALFTLALLLTGLLGAAAAQENYVINPGLEDENPNRRGTPLGWSCVTRLSQAQCDWVSDEVYSGQKAVRISIPSYTPPNGNWGAVTFTNDSVSWQSDLLPAPEPFTEVEVSAMVKAENVVAGQGANWYHLRFSFAVYDSSGSRIQQWDILSRDGTFDWQQVSRRFILPDGTATMRITVSLTASSGTAWMDDVAIRLVRELPQSAVDAFKGPQASLDPYVIMPNPWQIAYGDGSVGVESASVAIGAGDERLQAHVERFLRENGTPYTVNASEGNEAGTARLVFREGSHADVAALLASHFPGVTADDLGDEGYVLGVDTATKTIMIGANSERGRFYGLATLRQIAVRGQSGLMVPEVWVADRPALDRRGIVLGAQWFRNQTEIFRRMTELKMNYAYTSGSSIINRKLGAEGWRLPFTRQEKDELRRFLELAHENFVDVTLTFSPRGNPPTEYSSDSDIDVIVGKMDELYEIGFRSFGLQFDDLNHIGQHVLTHRSDIEKFNGDIGEAHRYFVNEIYRRITAKHPDVKLSIVPLWYVRFTRMSDALHDYLRTLAKLPAQIEFVSVPENEAEVDAVTRLTGRPPFVWDNFYTEQFLQSVGNGLPAFPVALDGAAHTDAPERIKGYVVLPAVPAYEDISLVSWQTSADYMWNPEGYDSKASQARALARAVGGRDNYLLVSEWANFMAELEAAIEAKADPDVLLAQGDLLADYGRKLNAALPAKLRTVFAQEITAMRNKLIDAVLNE